jgi:hypothetical protein
LLRTTPHRGTSAASSPKRGQNSPPSPTSFSSAEIPAPTIDDIIAETRETYDGPLVVGEDLMAFEIGATVSVRRY